MMGKRTSKPSMSDFLAQLPPPPPAFDDEVYGGGGFGKRLEIINILAKRFRIMRKIKKMYNEKPSKNF